MQGIWCNANTNPINALIPGWGTAFAIVQTALATARAGIQMRKIDQQQFADGGYTGSGSGAPDKTGWRPVGVVHEREWVSPAWMTYHPVWGQTVAALEMVRQRGFATGGYVSTTPAFSSVPGADGGSQMAMAAIAERLDAYAAKVDAWASTLQVNVVYSDIADAGTTTNTLKAKAGY